jgi:hypothetical protein
MARPYDAGWPPEPETPAAGRCRCSVEVDVPQLAYPSAAKFDARDLGPRP